MLGEQTLMEMMRHITRLFAYDNWANRETLASLKSAEGSPERPVRLLGHIIGVEWLWLARLKEEETRIPVWPDLSLNECELLLDELENVWGVYLRELNLVDLAKSVSYKNSRGEFWSNRVEDILIQILMHSVYHRGQIASDLRASENVPPYTDFIHCVRNGFILD
jgi:uncharacterized damage-inducible protein DinB